MSDFETVPVGTTAELERVKQERDEWKPDRRKQRDSYKVRFADARRQLDIALERDALAAHVERLRERRSETLEQDCHEIIDEWLTVAPTASLARRDAIKQAEALEEMFSIVNPDNPGRSLIDEAKRLRQQANQLEDS